MLRRALLQGYRLAVLAAIAWTVHYHHLRLRVEGQVPVTLQEVQHVLPAAHALEPDPGERQGLFIHDAAGQQIGYAVRTSPVGESAIGYRGWTDSLVVLDPGLRILSVKIRNSQDTKEHVEDIRTDRKYLKTWNGKSAEQVASVTPEEAGIEGVSGASMTSLAIAEAVMKRMQTLDASGKLNPSPMRFRADDIGLAAVIVAALVLAFRGTHGRPWIRQGFQVLVIAYVGWYAAAPLAQSLFVGWTQSSIPWRSAPGFVLLAAAALAVPWGTGKPLYCQHICPHGAAQELLHRWTPKRWRVTVPKDLAAGLRWAPGLLLGTILLISILGLPIDLAHLEPFDAYSLRAAGAATIGIAAVGLVAACFVPMAYCHYGCPTGALLAFVRSRGSADRFGFSDVSALLLFGLAQTLVWKYSVVYAWISAF
jgi:NosR/NirI family nitrous oxide reductase transcriptional regulator